MAEDLEALPAWLEARFAAITPGRRAAIARKIGQALRRANTKRIAANIQPDGSRMEPRKRRASLRDRKGKVVKSGKMFPKLRLARSMTVKATADGVAVGYNNPMIASTARAHQFGLEDYVGRKPDGQEVRARYPERVLLGFGPEDREMVLELLMELLDA